MKLKHNIDFKELERYIRRLDISEVETTWNKPVNPKLLECNTIDELQYFKKDIDKIPTGKIIQYGEPFLLDAVGSDLSVVVLSRRGYKLPTGRVINAKFITTIISDCRSLFGTPLNGYWEIPKQFYF